jgi:hypothetical protein
LKRLFLLVAAFCVVLVGTAAAQAPQFDLGIGWGTMFGQPVTDANPPDHFPQSLGGGGYPSFSGDFIFKKYFGVGGQTSWRAHQNVDIFFQPYRPILTDFNAILAPNIGKRTQAEVQGGIGWETIRFYTPFFTCSTFGCQNFTSSNHFLIHVGGGIRVYSRNNIFIRPEAHVYFIHNNVQFSGPRAVRVGATLGYSFRNQD